MSDQKKLISIVITLCSLFLALIFSFSTFAWMSMNKKLSATGASVLLGKNSDLGVFEVRIYKRTGADQATEYIMNNNTPTASTQEKVVLTEYDTVFTDNNVNTPLILRIELDNLTRSVDWTADNPKYEPFNLTIKCEGANLYLGENDIEENDWIDQGAYFNDTKYWYNKSGKVDAVLSNIIGFRCGLGNRTLNNKTNPLDIYSSAISLLTSREENNYIYPEKNFVLKDLSDKKGIIVFNFENYENYVVEEKVTVYLEIDYNNDLINRFCDNHDYAFDTGLETTDIGESIVFNSDLTNCFVFLNGTSGATT